ncbi:hypothetical protein [Arthrobacter sp. StoSoilB5]|uniref:hypothetical protein n=1 Tax=Arthrobacter sp. StoSoilB5 TaxID=2830992 RepID=UPI001CC55C4C|nr:hypothetical protein [Arthrobacter sp. StoSoilB5]BCW47072.1 hypothetical protein StoSoilB5_42560 [Arthrobacter sp. StoSoilB5]
MPVEDVRSRRRIPVARVLAVVGTVLVGIPLAAPICLAAFFLVTAGGLHLDFLMPGELFVLVCGGGVVLFAASLVSRRRRRLTGWLVLVVGLLFAANVVLAMATGLASGETSPEGWPLAIVLGSYGLYVVGVVALFAVGVGLCRELFAAVPAVM